jgi:RimJ/RimL family protein N-acetyltransferase
VTERPATDEPWITVIGDRMEGFEPQDAIGPAVEHSAARLGVSPLDTERLRLRSLADTDFDHLEALDNDPEVMQFITGGRPRSRAETVRRMERSRGHRWIAVAKPDDDFVGWFSLRPSAESTDDRELGYRLRRSAWGRGLASEGARMLVDLAFAELGAERVWAQTMTANLRSRRVMDRCGLRYSHTFHAGWGDGPIDGGEQGDVVYELTRPQWEVRRHRVRPSIRASRPEDRPALQDIEVRAGEQFRTVGLGSVADHDPFTPDELDAYADAGHSWVAVDATDVPVGYVLVDDIDGNAHIEQVSVAPEHQGEGIGRALVDQVADWAIEQGRRALTLTTFADVPWNRPLYEHLGFRVLAEHETGPQLDAIRTVEASHGLDPSTRVCMRLDLND